MALLEVLSRPLDTANPPDIQGTVAGPTSTGFMVIDGTSNIEIGGTGFTFDPVTGDPTAGTVTSIDWLPTPTLDFTITGMDWNLATHGDIGDTGFLVDGATLFGAQAEWAWWFRGNDLELGSTGNDTLLGMQGNDTISGNGGNDNLRGGSGDDVLYGGTGDDGLDGGAGNDTLLGGSGSDFFIGGAGNDLIDGGLVLDKIGYTDINTLFYGDQTVGVTINLSGITGGGGSGSGTATSTAIGTDTVRNVQYIRGGQGNDSIVGSSAQIFEMFEGNGGNDTIDGGAITSPVAANRVTYQNNTAAGVNVNLATGVATSTETGTDTLRNINQVRATNFDDTLTGSDRTDVAEAFEGRAGNDVIDGRGGVDTVRYDYANFGVNVNLGTGTAVDGYGTNDTLSNIENVRGSNNWGDLLVGNGGDNQLEGSGGNDTLNGGGGNDTLLGGTGSDVLIGGAGDDAIDGGEITDRVNYTDLNVLNYGAETASVTVDLRGIGGDGSSGSGSAFGAGIGNDTVANVNFITTGSGNDTLIGSSAEIFEQFDGGAGDDFINGGAITSNVNGNRVTYQNAGAAVTVDLAAGTATGGGGNDTLANINYARGTAGFGDSLSGSDRDDVSEIFEGLGGDDTIDGKGGIDIVRYDSATAQVVVDLGAGTASGAHGNDTLSNIEAVYGSSAGDILTGGGTSGPIEFFRGNAGDDTIDGGDGFDRADYTSSTGNVTVNLETGTASDGLGGTDTLMNIEAVRGSEANDSITGDGADNRLEGMGGNDTLNGGGGDDTLLGGEGSDVLIGGAGNDSMDGGEITDRINLSDLNVLNYAGDTAGVSVNLSGITGDGGTGFGTASGADIGIDTVSNVNFVVGGSGNDSIQGSAAHIFEQFEGGAGDDTIDGGAIDQLRDSNNRVSYQNAGAAVTVDLAAGTASGGAGNDVLHNINMVRASAHDDVITGSDTSAYTELFEGMDGDDTIDGRGGFDIVRYDGNSWVSVNLATGTSTGMRGDDVLINIEGVYGSNAGDTLVGGNTANGATFTDGKLEVFRGNGGDDFIDGGVGMDRADYNSGNSGVYVDLGAGIATDGLGGQDTLRNIEGIRGSEYADSLVGSDRATADGYFEFFEGRGGNDTIDGKGGVDAVYYNNAQAGVNVDLRTGTASDGVGGTDTLRNIENVRGSGFNDVLWGNAAANRLEGLDGNDTLVGEAGNDTLLGGAGNDVLVGGAGNDLIDGGVITDRLNYSDLNTLSYAAETVGVTINLSGITGDGSGGSGTATSTAIGTDTLRNVNFIVGGQGSDVITGSSALIFEQIEGGAGNDTLNGGAITDLVNLDNGNRVSYLAATSAVNVNLATGRATGGAGSDVLSNFNAVRGSNHNDILTGSDTTAYSETFEGRGGDDTIDGKGGFDIARYDGEGASIDASLVSNQVLVYDGSGVLVGTDTLANIEGLFGTWGEDTLVGGNAASGTTYTDGKLEIFRGGAGNDFIDGGAGVDRADYTTSPVFEGTSLGIEVDLELGLAADNMGGVDTLVGIEGIRGSDFDDEMYGSDRDATDGYFEFFEGRAGNDTIDGRGGVDWVYYNTARAGVNVDLQAGTAQDGYGGTDTLANIEAVRGSTFNDTLVGANGGTTLQGLEGHDKLTGGDGDDVLDGGKGNDTLVGGAGDDTYVVDALADVVTESAAGGTDRVELNLAAAGTYVMSANVEHVVVGGTAAVNVTGNAEDNEIIGNAGNNSLVGGAGADTLDGGLGNDTMVGGLGDDDYVVNVATDVVVETTAGASGGWDVVGVKYSGTYTLGANIEEAYLDVAGVGNLVGNGLDNWLDGNNFANLLSGGAGNDTIVANGGNDTIDGGLGTDKAYLAGSYDDYVISRTDAATTVLKRGAETVILRGVEFVEFEADGVEMTLAQVQTNVASPFNDVLVGDAGDDTIDGLAGNDSLSGDAGNDSLVGGTGADTLDGGTGDDTMVGGSENDEYRVDSADDVVVEAAAGGIDLIRTTLDSYSLAGLANVEQLRYDGDGDFTGTGNAAANALTGGAGNDHLDGGLGNDTMAGGAGDDTYVVNAATDVVVEAAGAGTDTVEVAYTVAGTYTLGANVENATATGSVATNLVGNTLDNRLEGNAQNNVLSGGAGGDTLIVTSGTDFLDGGADSDTAIFTGNRADWSAVSRLNATDLRVSNGASVVTLRGIENFVFDDGVLDLSQFTENSLSAFNDSWNGTDGNDESGDALAGNDTLDGKAGNDTLNGGLGADSMIGGTGDDVFLVDNVGDATVELADEGTDEVRVSFAAAGTYTLRDNVENGRIMNAVAGVNLVGNGLDNLLVGGAGANVLNAGAGNDTLDGGLGSDTLVGGAGDDLYVVNAATDVISEAVGGGADRVEIRYAANGSYTLSANVEDATVIAAGTIVVNVVGNASDNEITGHAGNNVLVGGAGNDILEGGGGNDTLDGGVGTDEAILKGALSDYTVTRLSATQTRFAHTDGSTVVLSGIENLTFYGADTADEADDTTAVMQNLLDLLGSPANDTLKGTAGADSLDGGAGNDLLLGNAGDDTLVGGAGNDILRGGAGDDLLQGGAGADTYQFGAGDGNDTIRENDATALVVDTLVIGADSGNLVGGEVRMVRDSADPGDLVLTITSGDAGEIVDTLRIDGFFNGDAPSATGGIEQIRFTDGNITLSTAQILSELLKGNGSDNWIRGYNGNDNINGLEGDDTLAGGAGNDTLVGNLGDDVLDGGLGADLLQGNLGMDTLSGGDGNDVLDGGAAADDLSGDAGADVLLGGAGDDTLDGGSGMDTLTGGAGNDTLTGGADADRFVLNSLTGTDEITDFTSGVDKIAINKSVFAEVTGAVSATPTNLAGLGSAFAYDSASGELSYDADGAGGADAVVVAQLTPGLTLANDFLIIG